MITDEEIAELRRQCDSECSIGTDAALMLLDALAEARTALSEGFLDADYIAIIRGITNAAGHPAVAFIDDAVRVIVRERDEARAALATMTAERDEAWKAGRIDGIETSLESVTGRLRTMHALNAVPAAIAMLEEVLVFLRAGLDRVKEGRGFHSTTQYAALTPPGDDGKGAT